MTKDRSGQGDPSQLAASIERQLKQLRRLGDADIEPTISELEQLITEIRALLDRRPR